MALFEMDNLYTFLQWIFVWLVQPIKRALNRLNSLFQSNEETFVDLEKNSTTNKSNKEIYEDLKNDSEWGPFFRREKYELRFHNRPPIGEGSQAEILEASGTMRSGKTSLLAVKIYNGFYLSDLQNLWPRGLVKVAFQHDRIKINNLNYYLCLPLGATVLEDDRFAFIYPRYGGDLRKLIDVRMAKGGNNGRPFSPCYAFSILHKIAKGMEMLHYMGFLHRDLKTANVLYPLGENKQCNNSFISGLHITDFESSVGTVGTGFWRAPEILKQLQVKNRTSPVTFKRQADVYSFGMTCYEVLTGHNPLEDQTQGDYDFVINGGRPILPEDIILEIRELLSRCWCEDPRKRPTFEEIVRDLENIGPKCNHAHYSQCEQRTKYNARTRGLSLRVDSVKVVVKSEQKLKIHNEGETSGALLLPRSSPRNIAARKEQKKKSIRREKSWCRRRKEKQECTHSFPGTESES